MLAVAVFEAGNCLGFPWSHRQCFGVMWKICRILSETSPDATDMARLIQLTVPFRKSFQLLPGPSHIHGSEKWFLPIVVYLVNSAIFHFHDYGRKCTCNQEHAQTICGIIFILFPKTGSLLKIHATFNKLLLRLICSHIGLGQLLRIGS